MKKYLPVLVFMIFAAVILIPLGARDIFAPDEDRYGEIAREMLVSGDFITPRLNGIIYFEKPVLGHWLNAVSIYLFGENSFAIRFSSALSALLCAVLIYFLAKKLYSGNFPIFAAALCFVAPLFFILGGYSVLDMPFTFFMTLGMSLFYGAVENRDHLWMKRTVALQFFSGLSFGAAFLTKGFLAFALPGSAIAVYMLLPVQWNELKSKRYYLQRLKEMFTLPWLPLIGLCAIALPWSAAIHKAQPTFWNYFFWEEHIQRFVHQEQHPQPWWFFIPILLGGLAHFVPLCIPAVRGLKKQWNTPLLRYAFCWAVIPFILLSMSTGKLGTYILPCFPPLMLLIAAGLYQDTVTEEHTGFLNWFAKITGCVLIVGTIGFTIYHVIAPPQYCLYSRSEFFSLGLILFCGIFAGIFILKASGKDIAPIRKWCLLGIAILPLYFSWQMLIPNMLVKRKSPEKLLQQAVEKYGRDVILVSFRYPFQGVCWMFKSAEVQLFINPGELQRGMEMSGQMHRVSDFKDFNSRVHDPKRTKKILLILGTTLWKEWAGILPKPVSILCEDPHDDRTYTVLQY